MESFVARFNGEKYRVRFDRVRYLCKEEKRSDPAFEVTSLHKREEEEEMRVAVSFPDITGEDDRYRKEQISKCIPTICSNPRAVPKFEAVTFVECEGAEAVVLPVSPTDFIQEILIGPRVSENTKREMAEMLKGSELASRVRELSSVSQYSPVNWEQMKKNIGARVRLRTDTSSPRRLRP